ncbi:EF0163 family protein [Enterococcus thailandicus]|uniref:EF0163 family protein n=1 Tax=Enterococcus thailandicus TaxID=417368 RepID=UPI0035E346DC
MKKIVLIVMIVVFFIGAGYSYNNVKMAYDKSQDKILALEKELKKEQEKNEIIVSDEKSDDEKKEDNKNDKSELAKSFTYGYTNFDSIDSRNEAIVDYVTNECKEENALDVKVHADFDSKAYIDVVYQDVFNGDNFILMGKEESRGASHDFLMSVHVSGEKIDSYSYKYVAQN